MKKETSAYPVEPWRITEENPTREDYIRNGTVFFLGNGYLGIRGGMEEHEFSSSPVHKGTYINGFYETEPIVYGESAYGFAREKQVMLNLADATEIVLRIPTPDGGDLFSPDIGVFHASRRYLDMKAGLLQREITWESPSGALFDIQITRMVSLVRRHLACIVYRVRPLRAPAVVEFSSALNGRTENARFGDDPRGGSGLPVDTLKTLHILGKDLGAELVQVTGRSGLEYACGTDHILTRGSLGTVGCTEEEDRVVHTVEASADRGEDIVLVKYIAYASTRDDGQEKPLDVVRTEISGALTAGIEKLKVEHGEYLQHFWSRADVRIEGDDTLQQGLRFNLLALLQSAGRDGIRSIAAKGLSGEGYEGQYFWDTEIYVLPFLIYTFPDTARSLLHYRYSILDKARERAAVLSEKGALFPWRTITGEEASAFFPAGTAQYHINADIVYGIEKYIHATGDMEFLEEFGTEMAIETARLWMSLGSYIPEKNGRFCLNCVTGPDEYTALVNNNTYTNIMARGNLECACASVRHVKEKKPETWKKLRERLRVTDEEIEGWRAAAYNMYIPYDRKKGLHLQDDAFLDKERWDFDNTPPENYPLLLHYHPLVIYRHQVLKQPDVVLAAVLRGDCFSKADKRRNFLYYDPLTTGDSSLGPCIQSVAAAEIGDTEKAYRYFMKTARMDLDDINKNVKDGVHTAAMAGTWISIIYGFVGMREWEDTLSFDPKLPVDWKSLEFRIVFRGNELGVLLSRDSVEYSLLGGEGFTFIHRKTPISLAPGESRRVSLAPTLEAVLFDLDGVVTDTAEYHYRAWKRLTEELGIPFDRDVNEQLRGIGRRESFEIILEHAGVSLSEQDITRHIGTKNEYYRELLADLRPKDILPGIRNFISDLRRRKIRTALISASRNAPYILKKLDLEDSFDVFVGPDEVTIGKPDPEICFKAAEKLGVPCNHCIGIEDAAAGVESIQAAGMLAVGIGPAAKKADLPLQGTGNITFQALYAAFKRME